MKHLKYTFYLYLLSIILISCGSYPSKNDTKIKEEPVVISNEKLEYEIIIIDPGFTVFLNSVARPKSYYSLSYLQNRNRISVPIWNNRVNNPQEYNPDIYENIIEYRPDVDYGLEVNYKLFWYFKFAEQKYKMKLTY